jgi:hypothetical protein
MGFYFKKKIILFDIFKNYDIIAAQLNKIKLL